MNAAEPPDSAPNYVLDASALLAFLHGDPGADVVEPLVESCVISTVNWAEVLQRVLSWGVDATGLLEDLAALGMQFLPFTVEEAEVTARFWSMTREAGLSLGDRACLSLAQILELPAVTADRRWATLNVATEVRLIR